jgi:hypothetical protein
MGNHAAVFLLRKFQTNSRLSEILLTDPASRGHSRRLSLWIKRTKCWLFSLVISEIAGFSIPSFKARFWLFAAYHYFVFMGIK